VDLDAELPGVDSTDSPVRLGVLEVLD